MSFILNPVALAETVPTLPVQRAIAITETLNLVMPRYGIVSAGICHEFIANVAHETQGFTRYEENLNYRAARLLEVFPKYFTTESAARYAGNKSAIGNRVYGARMGNGPEASGDGYRYRGGGGLHLTGRDMYQEYDRYKKTGLPLDVLAEKIRTEDAWAMDSACWVFAVEKKLIPAALRDDFRAVVKGINGGTIGLADRQVYYERAKKFIQ